MNVSVSQLKKLRQETAAGVADCRQALIDAAGDFDRAKQLIFERGQEKASKKVGKATGAGIIESYVHAGGRVGVLLELFCETDFVARTAAFRTLAHELVLQVAAMNPKDTPALLKQAYIRDTNLTIEALIKITISQVGENITVGRFTRLAVGE